MAHTPGPYHLGEAKSGRRFIYARNQEYPVKPEVRLNKTGVTKEMEDTAKLFAAAPELLSALKAIFDGNFFYHKVGDETVYQSALKAIAKAEGRL